MKQEEPFELFGVECGEGWEKLYKPVVDYIEEYNKTHQDDPIILEQIKEKWGELVIYVSHGPEELHKMIEEAEIKSTKVCENCGSEEEVGMVLNGWLWTCCLKCAIESAKARKRVLKWRSVKTGKIYFIDDNGEVTEKPVGNSAS